MDLRKDGADDDIWTSSTIHEVIKAGKQLWPRKKKNFNQGIHSCLSIDTEKMAIKKVIY